MKLSSIAIAAVLTVGVGAVACSSDDDKTSSSGGTSSGGTSSGGTSGAFDCDTSKSKCPNEPAFTAEDRENCKKALASATCAAEIKAVYECGQAKEVCAADGTSDTDATEAACKTENDAMMTCLTADAGG